MILDIIYKLVSENYWGNIAGGAVNDKIRQYQILRTMKRQKFKRKLKLIKT